MILKKDTFIWVEQKWGNSYIVLLGVVTLHLKWYHLYSHKKCSNSITARNGFPILFCDGRIFKFNFFFWDKQIKKRQPHYLFTLELWKKNKWELKKFNYVLLNPFCDIVCIRVSTPISKAPPPLSGKAPPLNLWTV